MRAVRVLAVLVLACVAACARADGNARVVELRGPNGTLLLRFHDTATARRAAPYWHERVAGLAPGPAVACRPTSTPTLRAQESGVRVALLEVAASGTTGVGAVAPWRGVLDALADRDVAVHVALVRAQAAAPTRAARLAAAANAAALADYRAALRTSGDVEVPGRPRWPRYDSGEQRFLAARGDGLAAARDLFAELDAAADCGLETARSAR